MGRGRIRAEGRKILSRGPIAKGLMGPVVIEAMGEGVDEGWSLSMRAGRSYEA
jgi:hypothetical protein